MTYIPSSNQSAIQEWGTLTSQIFDQAQAIIDGFARVKRIAGYNALDALIDGAEAGALVGDSRLTKEQAVAIRAVLTSFSVWLETPIEGVPAPGTPISFMSRRG